MSGIEEILIIDDDEDVGEYVVAAAQGLQMRCSATTDVKTFFDLLTYNTTLILVDLMMPEMDGIELLRRLSERKCTAHIVLISGIEQRVIETAGKLAKTLGLSVVGHLHKPFRLNELEDVLKTHSVIEAPAPSAVDNQIEIPDEHLRAAIERNEFLLHYQPQISLETGKVTGVEALARWVHPTMGLIYPDNFIEHLETLGLIDQLGWLVLNRGLEEAAQFRGEDGEILRISLNMSVHSLRNLAFPDMLMVLANEHGVTPGKIAIEITETGLINELSLTLDILTRLRMRNFDLSIDDFGTGYSMMRQLQNVPATELKIDKSFVLNMHNNDSDRLMVVKTIEIGQALEMQVMAEGVETQEQLRALRRKGCDGAQGYLISRPLPPAQLVTWLAGLKDGRVALE